MFPLDKMNPLLNSLIAANIKSYVPCDDDLFFNQVSKTWKNSIQGELKIRSISTKDRSQSQLIEIFEGMSILQKLNIINAMLVSGRFDIIYMENIENAIFQAGLVGYQHFDHIVSQIMNNVIQNGNVKLVEYLESLGIIPNYHSVKHACYSGNLNMIDYFRRKGFMLNNCCYIWAIHKGYDHIIRNFIGGYLPWNYYDLYSNMQESDFMVEIVKNGTANTMKLAIENNFVCRSGLTILNAIKRNDLRMVQVLFDNDVEYREYDESLCIMAAKNCGVEMVQYLHSKGYSIGSSVREEAMILNKADIVEYLDKFDCR